MSDCVQWHRILHVLNRYAHQRAGRFRVLLLIIWGGIWLGVSGYAFYHHPEVRALDQAATDNGLAVWGEIAYRTALTLTPDGSLLDNDVVQGAGGARKPVPMSPWENGARFLGFVFTLLIALPPLARYLLRRMEYRAVRWLVSGHYVIIGGDGAAQEALLPLLRNLTGPDCWRLVVVLTPSHAGDDMLRVLAPGVFLISGDAVQDSALTSVAVEAARGVYIDTGDESRNLDIAVRIKPLVRNKNGEHCQTPLIVPAIDDRVLLDRATQDTRLLGEGSLPHIRPFSQSEAAARDLVRGRSLGRLAALRPVSRAHIVILGDGNEVEAVLGLVAQAALYPGLDAPCLTVIQSDPADQAAARFQRRHPGFTLAKNDRTRLGLSGVPGLDLRFRQYDFSFIDERLTRLDVPFAFCRDADKLPWKAEGSDGLAPPDGVLTPEALRALWQATDPDRAPVTAVIVALGHDSDNLRAALALQTVIDGARTWLAPTFVRLRGEMGLASVLSDEEREWALSGVMAPFGSNKVVLSEDSLFLRRDDRMAALMNALYDIGSLKAELTDYEQKNGPVSPAVRLRFDKIASLLSRKYPALAAIEGELTNLRQDIARMTGLDMPAELREAVSRASASFFELKPTFMEGNRAQALHVPVKLYGLGLLPFAWKGKKEPQQSDVREALKRITRAEGETHAPLSDYPGEALPGRQQLPRPEDLARLEHDRWVTERAFSGWQYQVERDNSRLHQNCMLPWADDGLARERFKDREHLLNLDKLLPEFPNNTIWRPEIRLGFVGPVKLYTERDDEKTRKEKKARLEQELKNSLSAFLAILTEQEQMKAPSVTLVTALAPGSDILFVQQALEVLRPAGISVNLLVPAPLPPDMADLDLRVDEGQKKNSKTHPARLIDVVEDPKAALEACETARKTLLKPENRASGPGCSAHSWIVEMLPPGLPKNAVNRDTGVTPEILEGDHVRRRREERRQALRNSLYELSTDYICDRSLWLLVCADAEGKLTRHGARALQRHQQEPVSQGDQLPGEWRKDNTGRHTGLGLVRWDS